LSTSHVASRSPLVQVCKQVVTRLLSSRYQDLFALLVPSCCDKMSDNFVRRLMTITILVQVVPTRLFVTSCYEFVVINLLTTTVASLLASSTLLQYGNNLFQTCQQLHGNKRCEHIDIACSSYRANAYRLFVFERFLNCIQSIHLPFCAAFDHLPCK
jgi:hypothetical protein